MSSNISSSLNGLLKVFSEVLITGMSVPYRLSSSSSKDTSVTTSSNPWLRDKSNSLSMTFSQRVHPSVLNICIRINSMASNREYRNIH